jgi:hypothetical protein
MTELDVSAWPRICRSSSKSIWDLNIGDNIHASQIKLPKGVKLVQHGSDDPSSSASSARVALKLPKKAKLLPSNFGCSR